MLVVLIYDGNMRAVAVQLLGIAAQRRDFAAGLVVYNRLRHYPEHAGNGFVVCN